MALPFLPGNQFDRNLGKTKYHLSHHFDVKNEVAMDVGDYKPGVGGEPLGWKKPPPKHSAIPRGNGSAVPAFVAFDKQVLSFDAYYQEAINERREERYRVRKCKILFYLEDDSLQVVEPRLRNAGIPQGTIIKRHRIPKPAPHDDEFYTVEDLNVGNEIVLYSRHFKMTDCDQFTANFLKKMGVDVGQPSMIPDDPYMNHRKALDESMQPLRPYEKKDTLKQFLDHDRHVLRFECFWDDTGAMFGDNRDMILHYFLADDTIEIREKIPPNSGRDSTSVFLRRGKLPKDVIPLLKPGEHTDRTVLNVFGPMGHGGRFILDSLKTGAVNIQYYTDQDLSIGAEVNVWGRRFKLLSCDDFTKEFYKTKYGITDFSPIVFDRSQPIKTARQYPPYNGFGTEEDSLQNCLHLDPGPPKKDFLKFMDKDRKGLDSNVLRFLAKMQTDDPINTERRFIISYFLADDTLLVFEPPQKNTGVSGGKFLERGRVKKPGQERYGVDFPEYYKASDMFIGACVNIHNFYFELIDADEYALAYMESNSREFPYASAGSLMSALHQAGADNGNSLPMFQNIMSYESFASAIQSALGPNNRPTPHQILSLARYYSVGNEQQNFENLEKLVAKAQAQLNRANFENFEALADQCVYTDRNRSGFISREEIRTACRSLRVPIQNDILGALISHLPENEQGLVDYCNFVSLINWRKCPVPETVAADSTENFIGGKKKTDVSRVNAEKMLADLFSSGNNAC